MSVDLDNLEIGVDFSVASADEYADNAPALVPSGSYNFRLLDWELDTKGKYPAIVLKQVEIVEGQYAGRKIGFQRVYSTPFKRKDKSGTERTVSQLSDFLRAFDAVEGVNAVNGGIHAVAEFLNRAIDTQSTFKGKVDWEGFDKGYYIEQAEVLGIQKGDYKSDAAKELRKKSTLKSKDFAGKQSAVNPNSGNQVDAQVRLSNFYTARD